MQNNAVKWLYTIFFVIIGWIVFRADTLSDAVVYLKTVFGLNGNDLSDVLFVEWLSQNLVLLIIGVVLSTPVFRWLSNKTKGSAMSELIGAIGLCGLFVLSVSSLVSNAYNPFIYFNF